ncbi:MAG: thermonuclease family protein [Alphaproteobacteria bacterium]|nr:thermonuclease family protein [Alphaproteobacteria bacterium]
MGFLKKCIWGFAALALIFSGKAGVQSSNLVIQAGAIIGLIIGLIVLYVFIKMAWRAMGCLPALFIITAVVLFVLFGIGAFSGGVDDIADNIVEYFNQDAATADNMGEFAVPQDEPSAPQEAKPKLVENEVVNLIEDDKHKLFDENIKDKFLPKVKKQDKKMPFNPMKYPAIYGVVRVLNGHTLVMGRKIIKLFGVAAPDIKQTCAQDDGRGYRCGQQSALWLSEWLSDYEVECHMLKEEQGITTAVCVLGDYDIGAAIINAGWAVADVRESQAYAPYQNQAAVNRRGLWSGKFYMPWDWQKIQNRKANIKIIHNKPQTPDRKHTFSFF